MPKKGDRKEKFFAGNPTDPQGMRVLLMRYFEALLMRNYSPDTIEKHRLQNNDFIVWCMGRNLTQPCQVTRSTIQEYQRHLMHLIDNRGNTYSFRNQHSRICSVRVWFKWLLQNDYIPINPASDLEMPKLEQRLPKHVLTHKEAEKVLNQPIILNNIGLRDRAILETFYCTGIRRMELIKLQVYDFDPERRVMTIRQGKGKKDRVVPIGKRAIQWIVQYLEEIRHQFTTSKSGETLFLTSQGYAFSGSSMSKLVGDYIDKAEIGKSGSCHIFRHTMATLMLEGGADVRYVQAMLGHTNLETTQIYTRVSIRKLQQVHNKSHPVCKRLKKEFMPA